MIASHLPFLRRYSRALNGDQQSGDAYVAALLEAIIADSGPLEKSADLRVGLYQQFSKLWQSVPLNMKPGGDVPNWEASARRRLSTVAPKAREAFLLMSVEGFTKPQIGQILDCRAKEVDALIGEASRSIMNDVVTDVMIIEDEPIIAMELETVVESMGHNIVGVARTEAEAVKLASAKKPGLVLADIQLADGSSGIDATNKILGNFQVPIIFITAFPERLLTGERPEPAFLITKPFMPDMVKAVVSQALFFDTKAKAAA
jgi:CheY-like chemotaxis protein